MIRINLLPHREMRRERRKKDFIGTTAVTAVLGAAIVFAGGMLIDRQIDEQNSRNEFVANAIKKLDVEIAEIKDLESEISALQSRQKAVEDLQSDRTIPVHLFDELVKLMPEGVFLHRLAQQGLQVTMSGYAQSNERVAELYRNLSDRSEWLEKPQLGESKEVTLKEDATPGRAARPNDPRPQDVRRVYEFNLNVAIKGRPVAPAGGQPTDKRVSADAALQVAAAGAVR